MNTMIVNPVPSKTWYWLRMNERKVSVDANAVPYFPELTLKNAAPADPFDQEGSAGKEFSELVSSVASPLAFTAEEDAEILAPYDFAEAKTSVSSFCLNVPDGVNATLIMDFCSAKTGSALVKTNLRLGNRSHLSLVQIHRTMDDFTMLNDIGATVGEDSRIDLINLVISGKENDLACRFELQGKRSHAEIHTGYSAEKDHVVDFNYYVPHFGKQTTCNIEVNGVLRNESRKIFRGTIDFRRGSAGAKGSERENVLLIDDTVSNQTLPVILCSEEDVEGTHGASIGKLDDATVYYLTSRGLPQDQVYEMMALARLSSVAALIPHEATRDELEEYLERKSF